MIRFPSQSTDLLIFLMLKFASKLLIYIYRYYAAALPSLLNVLSAQCYLILNCIIGGQALAAVSNNLDDTLGIVIIGLISFVVGF